MDRGEPRSVAHFGKQTELTRPNRITMTPSWRSCARHLPGSAAVLSLPAIKADRSSFVANCFSIRSDKFVPYS